MSQLSDAADRLYAVAPDEFIAARKQAADGAEGELAKSIKQLRKPSTSAWLVNHLTRNQPGLVDELLELGAALREAQDALDADQLRQLNRERRQAVARLAAAATKGRTAGDSILREINSTLEAALADAGAGAALRSGRLVRALVSSGFDAVDLDGAVAVADELPALPAGRPHLRAVATPPKPVRTSTAQKAVNEAADRAAVAERALVKLDAALSAIDETVAGARERVKQAETELDEARTRLADADKQRTAAKRDRDQAARQRDSATQALRKAEAAAK